MHSKLLRLLFLLLAWSATLTATEAPPVKWEKWSGDLFARAKKEQRFVILDLEAVWCHWCHVMEETTYGNAKVSQLIANKYIAVKVDQDSRPDLSNRYEDYGWPATIVFAADGSEVVKRRGFIPPDEMIAMLEAIIADPSPGPSVERPRQLTYNRDGALPAALREKLLAALARSYDAKEGAWGFSHKYLDWDNVEWCLRRAQAGDAEAQEMARQTVRAQRALLDPVWGGMYQYSTDGDWVHPHFEKIMSMQAENLRIAALAYAQWGEPEDLATARAIERYLVNFWLDDSGAFYTSQDADLVPGEHSAEYFALDDAGRRAKGMPRIDRHLYTRENGWAVCGLATLATTTGDPAPLARAVRTGEWITHHRARNGGGFAHGEHDSTVYLGDQVAVVRAFLALHIATAETVWLERAEAAMDFIQKHFVHPQSPETGFATADGTTPAYWQVDENVSVARAANDLFHRTGKSIYRKAAARAMRYLATPEVVEERRSAVGGFLLADDELRRDPIHITVVGRRDDPAAATLFAAALRTPLTYRRLDWFDPMGSRPANLAVEFPPLSEAAAFICGEKSCSAPVKTAEELGRVIAREVRR